MWFTQPGFYNFMPNHAVVLKTKNGIKQNYASAQTYFAVGDSAVKTACHGKSPAVQPSVAPTVAPSTSTTQVPPTVDPAPSTSQTAPANDKRLWIGAGHADIFHVTAAGDRLELDLAQDVLGKRLFHQPENVVLWVKPAAHLTTIPAKLPGAPDGYVLPLTQDHNLLWPGWETYGVRDAGLKAVDLSVSTEGPGDVYVYSVDMLGAVKPVAKDGATKAPLTITAPEPAHTHAIWIFSKPGTYTMKVKASATKDGRQWQSPERTYTWVVGAKPAGDGNSGNPDQSGGGGQSDSGASSEGSGTTGPGSGSNARPPATQLTGAPVEQAGSRAVDEKRPDDCIPTTIKVPQAAGFAAGAAVTSGHLDFGTQIIDGKLVPMLKDDRSQPATWVNPSSLTLALGEAAAKTAPAGLEFIAPAGSKIWAIGAGQEPGVPWLGMNTMHESVVNGTTGEVTWQLDGVDGPGSLAVYSAGPLGGGVGKRVFDNVGGPTSYTVPANTHAHPNWVFSKPGMYKVSITQTATTKAGAKISGSGMLVFNVGGAAVSGSGKTVMVDKVVGRTADGKECTLSDRHQLSRTGADMTTGWLLGAVACVVVGAALLIRRRTEASSH